MTLYFCKKCQKTVLEWGGEELFKTFTFICDLYAESKRGPIDISWAYDKPEAYERIQLLESKGALISHETDKAILMRPNHVYFHEDLKCDQGCCPGFLFCVEGGHVSVAKE